MKTNSTFVLKAVPAFFIFFIITISSFAQCTPPTLKFVSPVLYAGTDGQLNAVYKFSNVTTGVDAYITIIDMVGGAVLDNIDESSLGYNNAWQPTVDGPGSPVGSTSYIKWRVDFKNSSDSSPHTFPCFTLSAIDVDGDNTRMREFVQAFGITGFNTHNPTSLTITNNGDSVNALGSVANSPDIDTLAWNTDIDINFNAVSSITLETGAYVDSNNNTGGIATARYNCIYFQPVATQLINNSGSTILPVTFLSFNALVSNSNSVSLNWTTANELNNNYFEPERSFDNSNFKALGIVLDAAGKKGSNKSYQFKDNVVLLQNNAIVYYRLKQVDLNGHSSYSKVVAVKLSSNSNTVMQVSPNPFAGELYVSFSANESGKAEVHIMNMTGQTVVSKQAIISRGYNNVQVLGLGGLPKGMYVAQLLVNGVVIDKEKIIKS